MSEKERLQELETYRILTSSPQETLDELAELASLICDTPISLITLLDQDKQYFLAKKGFARNETDRRDSFCQHALHKPREVLVVNDSLEDEKFKYSNLVKGEGIRFYAGAPIETPAGNMLGTLCILDRKPREITDKQKKALQILAKKTMDYLNDHQLVTHQKHEIDANLEKLKKMTEGVPGIIYQCSLNEQGDLSFNFISKGIQALNPRVDPMELKTNPNLFYKFIHPEDVPKLKKGLQETFKNLKVWEAQFRIIKDGKTEWRMSRALPEKQDDGSVILYGFWHDITKHMEYQNTMENLAFDISHVLRKPVSTLLGLVSIMNGAELDQEEINLYRNHISVVSEELDRFTRKLNDTYNSKRMLFSKEEKGL